MKYNASKLVNIAMIVAVVAVLALIANTVYMWSLNCPDKIQTGLMPYCVEEGRSHDR